MKITAISISDRKGIRKKNIDEAILLENFGVKNDAHAGKWHRQLSFLAQESIDTMRQKGLDVVAGNFAENITTTGIDLTALAVGTHLALGKTEVIISQLGKVCHHKCAIYHQAGDCVMPREGVFAVIKKGGKIKVGDPITELPHISTSAAIIGTKSAEQNFGGHLKEAMSRKFSPAFIRFDRLNANQDNLIEILKDLVELQKVEKIVLFDPDGKHGLALAGYEREGNGFNAYRREHSTIYLLRKVEELA